jgi:glycosyltransferase involved in cell wall biosynthesis
VQSLSHAPDSSRLIGIKGNAVIEVPKTKLSREELYSLYKKSHIGVYPSKGEGWNLDLFESIVAGLPCVASFVTAHTEYLDEKFGYQRDLLLYDGKEELASDGIWFHGDRGNWVAPCLREVTDKLRYTFDNYDSVLANFNNGEITETFTWKNSARQFINALVSINAVEKDMEIQCDVG